MKRGKLIKITFEYENELSILEGKEMCEAWKKDVDGSLQLEQLRNSNSTFPGLEKAKWKRFSKKKVRKMKLDNIKNDKDD